MVFSSLFFVFFFLPLNLALYHCAKSTPVRNAIMLVFSLVFYSWGEPKFVLLLIAMSFIDWLLSLVAGKGKDNLISKLAVVVACVVDLGLLGIFKYATFFQENLQAVTGHPSVITQIALPIGISFYTFQLLTYVVDVYRGDVKAERNFFNVLLYASLFHQCVAGPIVRYQDVAREIRNRSVSKSDMAAGITRFAAGLAKKSLLANSCGEMADSLLFAQNIETRPASALWLGMLFFTLQIYLDFSAYSDMAIGMGRMTGFHYKENFDYPYCSRSISEFWRRWHISLGSFFRDYVYIPLGGNRVKVWKNIRNIFVVWLLTGIWHGASWNFVIWGLYYGVLLFLEKFVFGKLLKKLPGILQHIYCLFFVMIGWNLFVFDDMSMGMEYLKALFGGFGQGLWNQETIYLLYNNAILLILLIVGSTMLPKRIGEKICSLLKGQDWIMILLRNAFYTVIFFLSVAWLVDASFNPFLYFRF